MVVTGRDIVMHNFSSAAGGFGELFFGFGNWKRGLRVFGIAILLIPVVCPAPAPAASDGRDPYYSRNQSPIVMVHGLPVSESASLLNGGSSGIRVTVNVANNYTGGVEGGEALRFDCETCRVDLSARYGLGGGWQMGLDLPYIWYEGGVFDSFIVDWHEFFGMPQGGRDTAENRRVNIRYSRDGETLLDLHEPVSGVGDVMVSVGRQLVYGDQTGEYLSLFAQLKLPTGDPDTLTGSGGTDFSMMLAGRSDWFVQRWDGVFYGTFGVLTLGDGEVLAEMQEGTVGFGSVGVAWHLASWLLPKFQVDFHTPFYTGSDLRQVSMWSAQLLTGATVLLPGELALDIVVVEDTVVETSPDVVFQLSLSKQL